MNNKERRQNKENEMRSEIKIGIRVYACDSNCQDVMPRQVDTVAIWQRQRGS